jgi:hypothetical protein
VSNQHVHELGILARIHPFLEIGEPFGEYYGIAVGIVWTIILLGTSRRVEQSQIEYLFGMSIKCQLAKTSVSLRTVSMQAERVKCRNILIKSFIHILQVLISINSSSIHHP